MNYNIKEFPSEKKIINKMVIEINFDDITKHLLIQRVFNNYNIITGILFLLTGVFLCFFGFYQDMAKILVCIIFGELITFLIVVLFVGVDIIYIEFLLIFIGVTIGIILSYFSLVYSQVYKIIIGVTSGTIFGIYLVDILFISNDSLLIYSILIDTIIISSISFIVIVRVLKKYYIFLNAVIGGYILIRGLSILLFKTLRYRELQIIVYFMNRNEWEYFQKNNSDWALYWIYDILIASCIILSIFFYYFQTDYYSKSMYELETDSEEEEEEIEDKN